MFASPSLAGDDTIATTLEAGTYYAVVNQNGAYTSHTLDLDSDLDHSPASDPNPLTNRGTATAFGSLVGEAFSTGGMVGTGGDLFAFYEFTMAAPGRFSAATLLNPFWSRSASALGLRVIREANHNGRYDAGEAVGSVGVGSLTASLGAGTNSDVGDVYKFTLPAAYTVTLHTTGAAGEDLLLQLIKDANHNGNVDNGGVIAASDAADSPFETITKTLPTGAYFARVHGVNGSTNYTLTATFASAGVAPVRLSVTGTGTPGSHNNSGNTFATALDGSPSTFFDGPNGNFVGLDLGAAKQVTQVAYASRSGWAGRMNGGVFQASNSATFASGNVTLFTIPSNANPTSTSLTTRAVTVAGTYRYVRYLSPNGSYGDVSEVQFFGPGTPTPTPTKLSGTTIGTPGSYNNGGNTIAKATDGDANTFFDGPTANGNWVGLDLGSAKAISQMKYAPRSGWAGRMVGGQVQVSTTADFSSGVTTLFTISATPPTGSLTTVTLATPVTARYVRYLSPNGSYGDVAEFQVFG